MTTSLSSRSSTWCFLLSVAFFVLVAPADAQTNTPSPTVTRTPVTTYTPAATPSPGENLYLCPEETYYYDEVDIQYIVKCGHCLEVRESTPPPWGNDIPDAPIEDATLPRTPLFTPGTPSPSPTIALTQRPTRTPFWFPTTTPINPTETLAPTPTDFCPECPTLTPPPTPTPEIEFVVLQVVPDTFATNPYFEVNFPTCCSFGYSDIGGGNFGAYAPTSTIGFEIQFPGLRTVDELDLTVFTPVRGCSGGFCGYDFVTEPLIDGVHVGDYSSDERWSVGSPVYSQPYTEGSTIDLTFTYGYEMDALRVYLIQYDSVWSNDARFEDVFVGFYDAVYEPSPTPTATSTPTSTPTPTRTPDPSQVDCRFPYGHSQPPSIVEGDLTQFSIVQQECYTIIPEGFYIDLSGFNPDWIISVDGLQICVLFVGLPNISIFGVQLPLTALVIAVIVGFIFRRFSTF